MSIMKESGIEAECGKSETDTDIILTIRIPKGAHSVSSPSLLSTSAK
jgi:hypothetical protein